jgi:hypothetical protein
MSEQGTLILNALQVQTIIPYTNEDVNVTGNLIVSGFVSSQNSSISTDNSFPAFPELSAWTTRSTSGIDFYFSSVAFSPKLKLFVAVARSFPAVATQIIRSSDGITWTNSSVTGANADYVNKVIWAEGLDLFLAVTSGPTASNRAIRSADGITWTASNIGSSIVWNSFAWSGASNPKVGWAIASNNVTTVSSTANGTTWSAVSATGNPIGYLNDITWSPELELFCAVGGGGVITTVNLAGTWTQRMLGTTALVSTGASCSGTTATITFGSAPNLVTGQTVWVQGFSVPQYNGVFTCTVSGSTITYTVPVASLTTLSASTDLGVVFGSKLMSPFTQNVLVSTHNWVSIAWSPDLGIFATVSATGLDTTHQVSTSYNGIDWTLRSTPEDNEWSSICWNSNLRSFIAVAESGTNRIMTSSDGVTWTVSAAISANQWKSVIWGDSISTPRIVAVSQNGTANRVMTNALGNTLEVTTNASAANAIANGTGAVASGENSIAISTGDGLVPSFHWNEIPKPVGDSAGLWIRIIWVPELSLFVTCANSASHVANRIATSPDGLTWTLQTTPASNLWIDIAWSPTLNLLIAVAQSGSPSLMRSSDGITWINTGFSGTGTALVYQSVTWSPELGIFVAVGNSACGTSRDGLVWTSRTIAAINWGGIVWSPELRIFAASAFSGSANQITTSPDGITWTSQTTPLPASEWYTITWSSELRLFVATSFNRTTNAVMTSSNGRDWVEQQTPGPAGYGDPLWIPELSMFIIMQRGSVSLIGSYITSKDGIHWIRQYYITNTLLSALAWSPTLKRLVVAHSTNNGFGYMDAIVTHAKSVGENSLAIGIGAQATEFGATAIGANMIADKPNGLFMRHRTVNNTNNTNNITQAVFIQGTNELVEYKTPAFHAYRSDSQNVISIVSPTAIIFNLVYTNNGGHYSTTTGKFTAPWPGLYKFYLQLLHRQQGGAGTAEITLWKNGVTINSRMALNRVVIASEHDSFTIDVVLYLVAGDTIQPAVHLLAINTDILVGQELSCFNGYFIGS